MRTPPTVTNYKIDGEFSLDIIGVLTEIVTLEGLPSNAHLANLSRMSISDLQLFKNAWEKTDPNRRLQIITRLEELAQDNIELDFDLIYKYCLKDADPRVRKQAIESLWENEDTVLIQTYTNMMNNDPDAGVQAAAAIALGKFVLLVEMEEIIDDYREPLSKTLLSAFNDKNRDSDVRRRALEAVAPLTLPAVQEAIRQAYDSRDERLVISAVYSMGKTCNEAWLPVLYKELKNPDPEMRYEAAGALGEIGNENSVQHLMEIINDPDIEVRQAVIQSLGEIGGNEAKQTLKKLLDDPNEAVRETATEALTELQQQEELNIW
jgi:HEAT repeat protein